MVGNSLSAIKDLKTCFNSKFSITELLEGNIMIYLKAECTRMQRGIFLTQRGYAKKILKNYGMKDCQPAATPIDVRCKLVPNMGEEECNSTFYSGLINSLLHLPITRFNIKFSIGMWSRLMQKRQLSHLLAAKRILRYIWGIEDFRILFAKEECNTLYGYVDLDWVCDLQDSKSTIGFSFKLGSFPITWHLKKQSTVALLSSEAKYRALVEASKTALWFIMLFQDLQFDIKKPIRLYCNNMGNIIMAINHWINLRTSHIYAHYHFTR